MIKLRNWIYFMKQPRHGEETMELANQDISHLGLVSPISDLTDAANHDIGTEPASRNLHSGFWPAQDI